jgi:integrase
MAIDISKAGVRERLPIDGNVIHWQRVRTGRYVGYRRNAAETGTWWARWLDRDAKKQHYSNIGTLEPLQPFAQWDAAVEAAGRFFTEKDSGVGITVDATEAVQTVKDACGRYVRHLRSEEGAKKADEAEARFRRQVYSDPLARVLLSKLKQEHVKLFRERLRALPAKVTRGKGTEGAVYRIRSDATFNRDIVALRAALNLLLDDGLIASDIAWRKYLKPIKNAGTRRNGYLDRDDRRALVEAASAEIRPFIEGMALLPLRPGALAALLVNDYDPRIRSLRVGVDKEGRDRRITVPDNVAALFKQQARNKLPGAPLFARADGSAWNKETWKGPTKDAAAAANLPAATTAYVLRHSVITDLVTGGLDLMTVATISGTSVSMIEKHYGHLQRDHAAAALAKLAL